MIDLEYNVILHKGFVRVYRKIISSAIWKNINDWRLAETILLLVNWKQGEFQSRNGDCFTVKRGELITSRKTLGKISGLTQQNIRTSLVHLEKSEFLTRKVTNHWQHIKVTNYNKYQDQSEKINQHINQDLTRTQPGLNQDLTTIEEGKEIEEGKKTSLRGPSALEATPPMREDTFIQKVVYAYKIAKRIDKNDKAWDRANLSRYSKAAKTILEAFDRPEKAVAYVLLKGEDFDAKGISWTLETIARWAHDEKGVINGHEPMGANSILEQGGPGNIPSSGGAGGKIESRIAGLIETGNHVEGGDVPGARAQEPDE